MAARSPVRPVAVDTAGTPGRFAQAHAIAILLQASTAEDWTKNHDAEWASLEGIARMAAGLGFRIEWPDDDPDGAARVVDVTGAR